MLSFAIALIGLQVPQTPADAARNLLAERELSRPIRFFSHISETSGRRNARAKLVETIFESPKSFKIDTITVAIDGNSTLRTREVIWTEGERVQVWRQGGGARSTLTEIASDLLLPNNPAVIDRFGSPLPTLLHRMLFGDFKWITSEFKVKEDSIMLGDKNGYPPSEIEVLLPRRGLPMSERVVRSSINRAGTDGWTVDVMHTVAAPPLSWKKAIEFTPPKE